MAGSAYTRRKSLVGTVLALAFIAVAVALGLFYVRTADENPLSQDAVLTADIVNVAASVPGRIVELPIRENGTVQQGDLLFALDPVPYRLAVEQAAADLKIAEAAVAAQTRTISAEEKNARIAGEQVNRARTNLALAEQTLARLLPLRPKGYVTAQQVDDARTARDDAAVSLKQAVSQAEAANVLVSTLDGSHALVEARQAALAIARHSLANTEVRAPHTGRIAGLTVTTGEVIAPSVPVFTLIDTGTWYASAMFRENDLANIRPGNCARVYAMTDKSRIIRGVVESIGWGVTSEDMLSLPSR
uniref:HlyD family efflux transporter periplasmic adaptor subunit n=1 Tax=Pseudoxanthobacter sp. TaxID=1925742 RepID=UPI002FE16955